MRDFNLFHFLHPTLKFDEQAEVLFAQIHHVISWFDLLFLAERYERWLIYYYGLIDFLKEAEMEEICHRLAMNEKLKKRVMSGKLQANQALLQIFSWMSTDQQPKRSKIYDILDPLSIESKLFMMAKTTQVNTRRYIYVFHTIEGYKTTFERNGFDSNGNGIRSFYQKGIKGFARSKIG
jgi:tRNA nucleotidyltransferase (CCA-adding enzyme)